MILSGQTIRRLGLIFPCLEPYKDSLGNSVGLSVCGYDLTLRNGVVIPPGGFMLASVVEYFVLPSNVVGVVHDKSSWARKGLAVQNTVAEPGWKGYLTLELTNHSQRLISITSGSAISQIIFHYLDEDAERPYSGKYQDQGPEPQEAM